MDQLLAVETALTRGVYDQTADLLNLEVDLLFFDTTSIYFELDGGSGTRPASSGSPTAMPSAPR